MANSIATRTNTLTETLDLIYRLESLTGVLTPAAGTLNPAFESSKAVQIAKRSLSGYGDYARQNNGSGYPSGDVSLTFETHTLTEDRGIELNVDRLDNDDSGDNAFLSMASFTGQFQREEANPEIDAFRFAKMASATGITTVEANLTATTAKAALDTAIQVMDDAEVPEARRVCFMSNQMYNDMKNSGFFSYEIRSDEVGGQVRETRFATYDGITIIKVPRGRFYTAITLQDGASTYGYIKNAATGRDLNFLLVHMDAVVPVVKHADVKYFDPDTNQRGDTHLLQARLYHDLFVLENKSLGIYSHHRTT